MFKPMFRSLGSILRSPKRLAGRSWASEMLFRTLRDLFVAGNQNGLSWFRAQTSKPIAHPAIKLVSRSNQSYGGVDCLVVKPNEGGDGKRIIVYLHGGGYVVGAPMGHLSLIAPLAIAADCQIIAADYSLAPEHPFPIPQDDCLAVANAVKQAFPEHKIILAGDSAGGALSIATALSMQQNDAPVDALILISPWVDPMADSGSIQSNADYDYLAKPFLDDSMQALMQGQALDNPRVNFTQVDLANLPPSLVQYGTGEIFADQITEFCTRASEQGVALQQQPFNAQFHVFQLFSGILKDAKRAVQAMGEFARQV